MTDTMIEDDPDKINPDDLFDLGYTHVLWCESCDKPHLYSVQQHVESGKLYLVLAGDDDILGPFTSEELEDKGDLIDYLRKVNQDGDDPLGVLMIVTKTPIQRWTAKVNNSLRGPVVVNLRQDHKRKLTGTAIRGGVPSEVILFFSLGAGNVIDGLTFTELATRDLDTLNLVHRSSSRGSLFLTAEIKVRLTSAEIKTATRLAAARALHDLAQEKIA